MSNLSTQITEGFQVILDQIPHLVVKRHGATLVRNAAFAVPYTQKGLKDLPPLDKKKLQAALIISAGPSIHKRRMLERIAAANFQGTIVTVDGAYAGCLKAGIIPDYVLTLDPNEYRTVRWFGDPDFAQNSAVDNYFARQDLAQEFRKNSEKFNAETIALVNKMSSRTKAIASTSVFKNVVLRLLEAKFDTYWWNPLADNPDAPESITRKLYNLNKLPCMNTGGTVGTAAWIFAATRLKIPVIGVVGMDFGYYRDNPVRETQHYPEMVENIGSEEEIEKYFFTSTFPVTGEQFYTDPTYYWYKQNFVEIARNTKNARTFNCTEAGTLIDENIPCVELEDYITQHNPR